MHADPNSGDLSDTLVEAFDSLPDAVCVFDYELRVRHVNEVAASFLRAAGIDPKAIIGQAAWSVLPLAMDNEWEAALRQAVRDRIPTLFERYAPSIGRWTETRIIPSAGAITAVTRDIHDRHAATQRAIESQALLDAILNNTTDAIFVKDTEGRYLAINRDGAASLNRTPEEIVGRTNFDVLSPDVATQLREYELEPLRTGQTTRRENTVVADGHVRHYITVRGVWRNAAGEVGGIVGVSTNITERRQRELETELLAGAGRVLTESMDYRTSLVQVAHLVAPALADWCSAVVRNADGVLETLAVAHADPDRVRQVVEAAAGQVLHPDSPFGTPKVIRTGESQLYPDISDDMLAAIAADENYLALLRSFKLRCAIIVPIAAHGRIFGALTVLTAESGRLYTERDLPIMEELGRRVALAIENWELFQAATVANRAKSEFLASISHELRTPLNAIIGYAELLGEGITGPVTPGQQEQLLRVRASAGHLLGLIEEVLSFSRMEAGQERVALQDLNVAALLDDAIAIVRPMAHAKKLPIVVEVPDNSLQVHSDALKLRQILVNLLTNAVKFTDEGAVTVSVRADERNVRFIVRDTGIGIAEANFESVFEPFWQVEQSAVRRIGGTGLGLSVTRRLAHLLDGQVVVESAPGMGSTFEVRLPRAPREAH